MTSQERHEARYQRRRAARRARQEARCAALGSLGEVFSYHTMFKYGRKCCNGVRWKQSTQNFERHLFSNTAKQRRLILAKRWRPKKYVHFTVCERGKIRGIDAPHITDRQIHKVISKEVLEPLYDPSMIYDNGASRIGKGLHWQIKRIKQQLARHYRKYGRAGGVLLLDLKKFFPYAPHSIIYQRHQRYILNPDFRRIADTIIDTAPGEFPGRGMPLGVEPSQQEMAAMPSAVDNWIKCQMSTHSAGHYMDDYCIILPNIEDGTALTCQDGFLMHKNQRVCAVGSQNGMDCFVQDDDGNGTLRGELVGNIQRCLERRDADYQTRWNRVWASALCQKYRRPESEDYWLWARAFFDAPIFDLQAIAALVQ